MYLLKYVQFIKGRSVLYFSPILIWATEKCLTIFLNAEILLIWLADFCYDILPDIL